MDDLNTSYEVSFAYRLNLSLCTDEWRCKVIMIPTLLPLIVLQKLLTTAAAVLGQATSKYVRCHRSIVWIVLCAVFNSSCAEVMLRSSQQQGQPQLGHNPTEDFRRAYKDFQDTCSRALHDLVRGACVPSAAVVLERAPWYCRAQPVDISHTVAQERHRAQLLTSGSAASPLAAAAGGEATGDATAATFDGEPAAQLAQLQHLQARLQQLQQEHGLSSDMMVDGAQPS